MIDVQFIVRWSAGNKTHYRVYDDESVARQAKKWLMNNGVRNVDIAVRINKKQSEKLEKDG